MSYDYEVDYLEDDEAVTEVRVQIVNLGTHTEGVHPVPIHLKHGAGSK